MGKQKGLAPILIVILIALAVGGYLYYQKQNKPTSVPQQNTQSSPTSNETIIWKTYKDSEIGFMINYPDSWMIEVGKINYLGTENPKVKIPVRNVTLKEKNGSASISITVNFQGGYCEGGGCTQEDYKTKAGVTGKKYTSKYSGAYYSLRIEPNNLTIMTDTKSQTDGVSKIIDSIAPLK